MKITSVSSLSLAFVLAVFTVACQSTTSNNTTANTTTNTNMSGRDMSNMNHDVSNMQRHEMTNMNSDPDAAKQPYDLQFLDSMIHHHRGAAHMATMVLGKTERPEMKAFAQKIIADQTKEIDYMKGLREPWYAGKPSAINMELAGMIGGMKMMNGEHMKEMDDMEASHFDSHFLKMMIAHHEGAVTMSNDALKKAEHPEIKKLAEQILNAQRPQIEQMKQWQKDWEH